MASPRRIAVAATLAVAAAAAVILPACGDDESSPRLDALRTDPLGRHSPAGARLAHEIATPEGETLGKPRPARFARWFPVAPGEGKRQFGAAVDAARAAGWQLEETSDGSSAVGSKQIAGGAASAVIAVRTDARFMPSDVPAPALEITLER